MKKIFLALLILISPFLCFDVNSLEEIKLLSNNFVIYDMTEDELIESNNLDEVVAIASLTKIMTTITAINNIEDLEAKVTITRPMLSGIDWDATLAGLKEGDVVTYRDLLYASMLPSGADATQALAYSISGSIPAYVAKMNELAKSLDMTNTNFVNVTGLDIDNHYSSVNDILKLLKYSLKNDLFKSVYTTRDYTLTNGLEVHSTINKYNKTMNLDTSRIMGAKTGFTDNAGLCISFIFNSNGHDYIGITTNAKYVYGNFANLKDALNIINYVDSNYNNQVLVSAGTKVASIKVRHANVDEFDVVVPKDVVKYLRNDYDLEKVRVSYTGEKNINFNYDKNAKLGTIKYTYNDVIIREDEVLLNEELKFSVKKFLIEYKSVILVMLCCFLLLIILLVILFKKHKRRV